MSIASFLQQLCEDGHVRVPAIARGAKDDLAELDAVLLEMDSQVRAEAPGDAPALSLPAARWAAALLFKCCQALVFRDAGQEFLKPVFAEACPQPANAAAHYSVDLVMRYLPDVYSMACRVSHEDPLVEHLRGLAASWPLSSVGICGVEPRGIDAIAADNCLLRLYADRVMARRDLSRLTDPRVRDAVRRAIGCYADLSPELAAAVAADSQEGSPP